MLLLLLLPACLCTLDIMSTELSLPINYKYSIYLYSYYASDFSSASLTYSLSFYVQSDLQHLNSYLMFLSDGNEFNVCELALLCSNTDSTLSLAIATTTLM